MKQQAESLPCQGSAGQSDLSRHSENARLNTQPLGQSGNEREKTGTDELHEIRLSLKHLEAMVAGIVARFDKQFPAGQPVSHGPGRPASCEGCRHLRNYGMTIYGCTHTATPARMKFENIDPDLPRPSWCPGYAPAEEGPQHDFSLSSRCLKCGLPRNKVVPGEPCKEYNPCG